MVRREVLRAGSPEDPESWGRLRELVAKDLNLAALDAWHQEHVAYVLRHVERVGWDALDVWPAWRLAWQACHLVHGDMSEPPTRPPMWAPFTKGGYEPRASDVLRLDVRGDVETFGTVHSPLDSGPAAHREADHFLYLAGYPDCHGLVGAQWDAVVCDDVAEDYFFGHLPSLGDSDSWPCAEVDEHGHELYHYYVQGRTSFRGAAVVAVGVPYYAQEEWAALAQLERVLARWGKALPGHLPSDDWGEADVF